MQTSKSFSSKHQNMKIYCLCSLDLMKAANNVEGGNFLAAYLLTRAFTFFFTFKRTFKLIKHLTFNKKLHIIFEFHT